MPRAMATLPGVRLVALLSLLLLAAAQNNSPAAQPAAAIPAGNPPAPLHPSQQQVAERHHLVQASRRLRAEPGKRLGFGGCVEAALCAVHTSQQSVTLD